MSVPPSGPPASTPPSKDDRNEGPQKSKKDKEGKEFKLPSKKEKEKEEMSAAESKMEQLKSQTQAGEELKGTEKLGGVEAKAQIAKVNQAILRMVEDFRIGEVGGQRFAQAKLTGVDAPEAFAGSNLTLSYEENGLLIRFDNFTTPQQAQNAMNLVDQNKEQLAQLVQRLQEKNIQIAELNIGGTTISLPRAQPLPPPFQPTAASPGEARREGGGEDTGKEEAGEGLE